MHSRNRTSPAREGRLLCVAVGRMMRGHRHRIVLFKWQRISASSCSTQCVPVPWALLPASTAAWNAASTDGVSGSHSQCPSTGCPNRPTQGNRQRRRIHGREAAGVHMPASLLGDVGDILRGPPCVQSALSSNADCQVGNALMPCFTCHRSAAAMKRGVCCPRRRPEWWLSSRYRWSPWWWRRSCRCWSPRAQPNSTSPSSTAERPYW